MERSKLKEALRPFVKEALSDYLKDSEQETRALQAAHPQLDIKSDLPSETDPDERHAKFGVGESKINESDHYTINWEPKEERKMWVQYSYTSSGTVGTNVTITVMNWDTKGGWKKVAEKKFSNEKSANLFLDTLIKRYKLEKQNESVQEASTTAGGAAGDYQTPYAFSDGGLAGDAKKRKIAQQLGYKLVEKNRLKEEIRVNVVKAVPLLESFRPTLHSPVANSIYMKMLDYLLMTDDPKREAIRKFRRAIDKVPDATDKKQLILAFNDEFRVSWGSAADAAWNYYK